jgi:hypothetical protein
MLKALTLPSWYDNTRAAKPMKVVLTDEFGVSNKGRRMEGTGYVHGTHQKRLKVYAPCQTAICTRHRYQRNDTGSNFLPHVVSGLATGTSSRTSKNVDNTTNIREQGQPFDVE